MTHSAFEHLRNQLREKDRRTPNRRLRPISSSTAIQLANLREKLESEYIIGGAVPATAPAVLGMIRRR